MICQTTLDSRMRRNSRTSVAYVNEDSACCVVASLLNFALFNLIVVINKHSLKVFSCNGEVCTHELLGCKHVVLSS